MFRYTRCRVRGGLGGIYTSINMCCFVFGVCFDVYYTWHVLACCDAFRYVEYKN